MAQDGRGEGQLMGTDSYYAFDPVFNDTSDFIECDTCGSLFDHNEYKSFTCSRCESGEYDEKEEEKWNANAAL